MLIKNIYTRLSLNEIAIYTNIYGFFIIKDSYFFSNILNSSKYKVFNKLISKNILKNSLFLDNINIKTIKFPVLFSFFTELIFFEKLFLNFFSKKSLFLFLKSKSKLHSFRKLFSKKIMNPKNLHKPKKLSLKIPFNFLKTHMYSKIEKRM